MTALKQLIRRLRLDIKLDEGGLFYLEDNAWKNKLPYRLNKGLKEICPDAFFVQNGKPLVLFFDFTKEQHGDEKELFKKIWNLGGVPIVYVIKDNDIEIYNGFSFDSENPVYFERLEINGKEVKEEDISFWDILSGKLWQQLPKIKNQVDENLLKNIEDAQKALKKKGLDSLCANNIIGRLLFTRYLIDRDVKIKYFKDNSAFKKALEDKNKELLYKYFKYLEITFNGGLFPVSSKEKQQINNRHLKILFNLFSGAEIESGQQSLFEIYNFKIIPIELISEVYERFMGKEKQQKDGAYYTPSFLVDYILEKTVKEHLEKNNFCRVFDPSCGSGIFLVETLRCIIEKNLNKNGKISKEKLKKIVKDNIFGVDKNEIAINLSVFSICLTLLDYIESKDITKFRFEKLKDRNLFAEDFFNTKHSFNKEIKGVDYILGNPPWGSDKEKEEDNLHLQYIKDKKLPVSDKQLAQSFTLRAKDFSSKKTKCALVLTSKILYNHNAGKFRKYWLENFYINEVLELSPVRDQLFSKATAPAVIAFYQYAHKKGTKDVIITHTSIKPNIFLKYLKILVIEKNDVKEIKQEYFQKYDWLWKTMLYGNAFDFYFIKRLKDNYKPIKNYINKFNIVFGAGFKVANKKNKLEHFSDKYLLKPRDLYSYKLPQKSIKLINEYPDLLFEDGGVEKIYRKPHLLLKRSLKDRPILTYSEDEFIFPNTIFGIHGEDKEFLKATGAYFSSSLTRYLLFLTSTTWGVEREEVLQKEYKELPFLLDENIKNNLSQVFDELINISKNKYSKKIFDNTDYEKLINKKIKKLDLFLFKKFELSEQDKRLIDYNINISIPLFFGKKEPIAQCDSAQLKNYAQIFLDHFGSRWNGNPDFFEIDIYSSPHVVGMNFKVVKEKRNEAIEPIKNLEKTEELFKLMKLGERKYTKEFYEQKDIRGFNKTSFYIVKSNQYKNWHPAVAQADLHEFIEEMMKSEINYFNSEKYI